jgi:leucyl-tRNA synthetase
MIVSSWKAPLRLGNEPVALKAMSSPVEPVPATSNPENESAVGRDFPEHRYTATLANSIEPAWQDRWEAEGTYNTPNPVGALSEGFEAVKDQPKLFVMDMFPYPSGAGLHVGHPLGFIGTDVFARYKRMTGHNVLHTMGFDSFGLPAEQYAVQTGTHPRTTTEANVANYRRQIRSLGLGHDPRRSVATTDVEFYRWTQWIFLQVFNSYLDETSGKAQPIADLQRAYESGTRVSSDGRAWSVLSNAEQRTVIDSHRLAYVSETPVNWCPGLGTVVANEEVTADGRSDRGNFPVFKRNMRQWNMRITAYADRLINDLDLVDWPEPVRLMQRNWIGRSHGARVRFASVAGPIEVFTTRSDTLFGATYMVLAPEHALVDQLASASWPEGTPEMWTGGAATPAEAIAAYRRTTQAKSAVDRQVETREKTGVFLGVTATNPVNGAAIPVFIADYVLMGYGTGAIMAVPSGDQRDFEFARIFGLPIVATQQPTAEWFAAEGVAPSLDCDTWSHAYVGEGAHVDSARADGTLAINGTDKATGILMVNEWLTANDHGHGTINYKLRDWGFSRQRYWGEPIPVVFDETGLPIALPASMLPLELPETDQFSPRTFDPNDEFSNPEAPLDRLQDWVNVELDLGDGMRTYRRDTNVMPQWAGSCSYYLRYIDPIDAPGAPLPADPVNEQYWMGTPTEGRSSGVDLYVGGVEHAVLHLLYSRFWHKVLFDLGYVSTPEPFQRLFNQGYIQAYSYTDSRGMYVEASQVVEANGKYTYEGEPVTRHLGKIGKSLKNSISPDDMVNEYGADTFRLYEMAMGPLEQAKPWDTRAVSGSFRLLQRVWRTVVNEDTGTVRVTVEEPTAETLRILHSTIAACREAMDALRMNTPVARITELNNHLTTTYANGAPRSVVEPLVLMLAPFAPHMAEELWGRLGHDSSLVRAPYPVSNPAFMVADTVEVPVQINGKLKTVLVVPADADAAYLEAAAKADEKVAALLEGKTVRKVIAVAGRLVNLVVG